MKKGIRVWLALSTLGLMLMVGDAQARTIRVDTTADENGKRKSKCSLREAIRAANSDKRFGGCSAGDGRDLVQLQKGTYRLTHGSDEFGKSILVPRKKVAIRGRGAASTKIDGLDRTAVFVVPSGTVSIAKLAIQNGVIDGAGGLNAFGNATVKLSRVSMTGHLSGALLLVPSKEKAPKVTVDRSTISGNQAFRGAGADVGGGTLVLKRTLVAGNEAQAGAGISLEKTGRSVPTLKMVNSAVGSNMIVPGTGRGVTPAGLGGGIYSSRGKIVMKRSTVSLNTGATFGGGLHIAGGSMSAINSTISKNQSDAYGGGIATDNKNGESVTLKSVTVAQNRADANGTNFGDGGGISSDTTRLKNTIVADNIDPGGQGPDCFGTYESLGHNLFSTVTGCNLTGSTGSNKVADPLLGPLAPNGNLSPTHSIPAGSPARNSGANCPKRDQRNVKRRNCDIGAFEYR